jgi:hypothetical protein
MPRQTPSYRLRKGYGQAIVTLSDSVMKRRRDYRLGDCGSSRIFEGDRPGVTDMSCYRAGRGSPVGR